jgi:hypothetical protein
MGLPTAMHPRLKKLSNTIEGAPWWRWNETDLEREGSHLDEQVLK